MARVMTRQPLHLAAKYSCRYPFPAFLFADYDPTNHHLLRLLARAAGCVTKVIAFVAQTGMMGL